MVQLGFEVEGKDGKDVINDNLLSLSLCSNLNFTPESTKK